MRFILLAFAALPCFLQAQTLTSYTTDNGLVNNTVLSIAADDANGIWAGTQEGLVHFDGTTWLVWTTEDGLVNNTVFAVMYSSDGIVWSGGDDGINAYNGTDFTTYTTDDGLEDNRIKTIFEATDGLIWFGHNDGVSSFDGSTFVNFTTDDGLPFGGVSHITEDNDGDMWFGTGIGGVFELLDGTLTSFSTSEGLVSNAVRSLATDASNNIWIGTAEGIMVVNQDHDIVAEHASLIELPEPHVINPVEDIDFDSEGRMWAAVYVQYLSDVGGVAVYDGGVWTEFNADDGLISPSVTALTLTDDNACWVATTGGITRISDVPLTVSSAKEFASLALYPNPCTDRFTLDATEAGTLAIYNLSGQMVVTEQLIRGRNTVSVATLPAGMYRAQTNSGSQALIVQ